MKKENKIEKILEDLNFDLNAEPTPKKPNKKRLKEEGDKALRRFMETFIQPSRLEEIEDYEEDI